MSDFLILAVVIAPVYTAYVFKGDGMKKLLSDKGSNSKPFRWDGNDGRQILLLALAAGGGAFLTSFLGSIDSLVDKEAFGEWSAIVGAASVVVVDALRKLLADNT